jgi:hypothetical protein
MTTGRWVALGVSVLVVLLIVYVASNTTWEPFEVDLPPKGEARLNPFYATQRLAEELGAETTWQHGLGSAEPDAVLVASALYWTLIPSRRVAIEQWVENGGRLVVDGRFLGTGEFDRWSGVSQDRPDEDEDGEEQEDEPEKDERERAPVKAPPRCRIWKEDGGAQFRSCGYWGVIPLKSTRPPIWSLRDEYGLQAVRVSHGRGSITVVNGTPFATERLLDKDGDHARLFVAATQLQRGDRVYFVSENERPSLMALIWQHGAPVLLLAAAWLAVTLWRGGVRFGPRIPEAEPARRSLAEQIRGTAQFALRFGGGESLYEATLRAFSEAARKRIPGFAALDVEGKAAAVAGVTGFESAALAAAMTAVDFRRVNELRSTIALLEAARRHLLIRSTGPSHGTD